MQIKTNLANPANYGGHRTVKPQWIVMHYTANDGDSDDSNAKYFKQVLNPVASAHYFVDDDSATLSVPEDHIAYHCGGTSYYHPYCRNSNSIGIEMCDAKKDGRVMATRKTIENAAELVASLCIKYDIPVSNIIRHYDVTHKMCPMYWVNGTGLYEFRDLVKEEIKMQTRIKTLNDVPNSLKAETKELIDSGALKGAGGDKGLDVTEDMLRCMIIMKRYMDKK